MWQHDFSEDREYNPVNREDAAHEVYVDVKHSERLSLAIDRLRGEEEACKTMCGSMSRHRQPVRTTSEEGVPILCGEIRTAVEGSILP